MKVASATGLVRRSGRFLQAAAAVLGHMLSEAGRELAVSLGRLSAVLGAGSEGTAVADGAGSLVVLLRLPDRRYVESLETADGETMVFSVDACGGGGSPGRGGRVAVEAPMGRDPYGVGRDARGEGALVVRVDKKGEGDVKIERYSSLAEAVAPGCPAL